MFSFFPPVIDFTNLLYFFLSRTSLLIYAIHILNCSFLVYTNKEAIRVLNKIKTRFKSYAYNLVRKCFRSHDFVRKCFRFYWQMTFANKIVQFCDFVSKFCDIFFPGVIPSCMVPCNKLISISPLVPGFVDIYIFFF